MSKSIIHL